MNSSSPISSVTSKDEQSLSDCGTAGSHAFGTTWWGRRWLDALSGIDFENRIPRGQAYAREGKVLRLKFDTGRGLIKARVAGNYDPFYAAHIELPQFTSEQKETLAKAIARSPAVLARLAAREVDPRIEELAAEQGIKIFPSSWQDLKLHCSCPDTAVPCKHLAAVIYKISQEIDANPFLLFALKGLDLIEDLRALGIEMEQTQAHEMPTWHELMERRPAPGGALPLESLQKLSFQSFSPMLDTLCNLFTPAPAGYTAGELRETLRSTLRRAAELAGAQMQDETERRPPQWNHEEPLFTVTSWGKLRVSPSLSWEVCVPVPGSVPQMQSRGIDEASHPGGSLPLYEMFSGGLAQRELESAPLETEALYHLWLLSSKLVQNSALQPQIYEPIEDFFAVRWLPATLVREIGTMTEQAGRALLSLPEGVLRFERAPESLNARFLGETVLGFFIESYVREAWRQLLAEDGADGNHIQSAPSEDAETPLPAFPVTSETEALFAGKSVDVTELTAGPGLMLALEAWLSPLYLENLTVSPMVIFVDKTEGEIDLLAKMNEAALKRAREEEEMGFTALDPSEQPGESAAAAQDLQDSASGPSGTAAGGSIVLAVPEQAASADEPVSFTADSGIGISMGFKRTDIAGTTEELFIPLSDVIHDERYARIRFECLRTVARLSSICPELGALLEEQEGEGVVDLQNLGPVLLSAVPALRLLGVTLIIPKCLKRLVQPAIALKLDVGDSWDEKSSFTDLEQVVDYDWKLALGGQTLSLEAFDELVKYEGQVVRFGAQFVYVDANVLGRIGRKLHAIQHSPHHERLNRMQMLAALLTGSFDGNEVVAGSRLKEALEKLFAEQEVEVPPTLNATLRPYQVLGFSWLVRNLRIQIGSILADDMGLGKTLQVITCLERLRLNGELAEKRALVVAPTSLLTNWGREIRKFAPGLKSCELHGAQREVSPAAHVILTSYGTLRARLAQFQALRLRVLIVDEAQAIKNRKSQISRALRELQADAMIAMSGTPVENRLMDYWSVMDFVNPGLLGSAERFGKEFAKPIESSRDPVKAEQFRRVTAPFIMRRLKSDRSIIRDLPAKLTVDRYCALTPVQAALYEAQVRHSLSVIEAVEKKSFVRQSIILNLMRQLKMICNSPEQYSNEDPHRGPQYSGKTQVLFDLLDELLEARRKTLIFTQFVHTGELLQQWIGEHTGQRPQFLHGGLSRSQRGEIVDKFQSDRSERCLILSLKAAGTGLNLTAASAVIHYDLWWNPAVEDQATDRAYRIGQQREVEVYRLICANTFEEKINQMIASKRELAELTVSKGETWIGDLSNHQLEEIFTLGQESGEAA